MKIKWNKVVCALLVFFALVLSSCEKSNAALLFEATFDDAEALTDWSASAGGRAEVVQGHVKLQALSDCFVFETLESFEVKAGRVYYLSYLGKITPFQIGDPTYCASFLTVKVMQGQQTLVSESFGGAPDWAAKGFSFQVTDNAPIKIRFEVGSYRGVWLDDVQLVRQ
jgi:hypothetical protein